MKNLDLNAFGVQRMDTMELLVNNGGSPSQSSVGWLSDESQAALGDMVTQAGYFVYGFVVGFFD